ncbi:MAG TPA: hypothetical protein VK184_12310 [Nostocaceae cyanobacterium]|nr:hypothetical protein [Nostocaceae cyanobacterium]
MSVTPRDILAKCDRLMARKTTLLTITSYSVWQEVPLVCNSQRKQATVRSF